MNNEDLEPPPDPFLRMEIWDYEDEELSKDAELPESGKSE